MPTLFLICPIYDNLIQNIILTDAVLSFLLVLDLWHVSSRTEWEVASPRKIRKKSVLIIWMRKKPVVTDLFSCLCDLLMAKRTIKTTVIFTERYTDELSEQG